MPFYWYPSTLAFINDREVRISRETVVNLDEIRAFPFLLIDRPTCLSRSSHSDRVGRRGRTVNNGAAYVHMRRIGFFRSQFLSKSVCIRRTRHFADSCHVVRKIKWVRGHEIRRIWVHVPQSSDEVLGRAINNPSTRGNPNFVVCFNRRYPLT